MKKLLFAAFVLCFTTGCVSTGKYNIKCNELDECNGKVKNLNEKIVDLTVIKKDLKKENEDLKNRLLEMTTDQAKLQDDLAKIQEEKEKAIAELKNTYDNFVNDLQSEIKNGQIKITQLEGKLTVNMVDKILFDSGKANVNDLGKNTLDTVGAVLKKVENKQIRVEGHTDNVPINRPMFPSNWELSTARATNVARYLIDTVGVDLQNISVSGYADTKPIDTNDTPEGKANNRRIEIVLLPLDKTE